jgi:hypothetical protein
VAVSSTNDRTETNLRRLRQENSDLRRVLQLYEEALGQLTIENTALRQGAAVVALSGRARPGSPPRN